MYSLRESGSSFGRKYLDLVRGKSVVPIDDVEKYLVFVTNDMWKALFSKAATSLERNDQKNNECMSVPLYDRHNSRLG